MKILLVMDPGILIPPKGYGGIERIVALLAQAYYEQGHTVDVLCTEGSYIAGCTIHGIGPEGFPPGKKVMNRAIFSAWKFIWKKRNDYDLIHNFGRLLYLLPVLNNRVKKIMCYQREVTRRNIQVFDFLPHKNMVYSGCSADLVNRVQAPGRWAAIYNGIDFNQFTLTDHLPGDAPIIFLGRIERVKGCHTAIAVAKACNQKLIIAGNISPLTDEKEYYKTAIEPLIDGEQIQYVGPVNDLQKNEWLGKSKALLMPIEWNEPFGIVMIEAMACGTPVIAYKTGSVDEVVEEGITGLKVSNQEAMEKGLKNIYKISRTLCRSKAKEKFEITVIANDYLSLFRTI